MEVLLRREGHEILSAGSAAEGIRLAEASPVDLVFMDVHMPQQDGVSASREMRRRPALARTPILLMSGSSTGEIVLASQAAGAQAVLRKPAFIRDLVAIVREHLGPGLEAQPEAASGA
jgi:CheY-like chemotaxis protein